MRLLMQIKLQLDKTVIKRDHDMGVGQRLVRFPERHCAAMSRERAQIVTGRCRRIRSIALFRKALAAFASRRVVRRKSTIWPFASTARHRSRRSLPGSRYLQ